MEWLQIYKIGEQLINAGINTKYDSFYNYYKEKKYEEKIDGKTTYKTKTPFVLNIGINTNKDSIKLSSKKLNRNEEAKENNCFTTVSGRFNNYYLSTTYENRDSIKNFFEDKSVIQKNGKKKLAGFEKEYEDLIKEGLLSEEFRDSELNKLRKIIIENNKLHQKLNLLINNLPLLVENGKQKEYNDKTQETENKKYDKTIVELNINPLIQRLDISKSGKYNKHDIAFITITIIDKSNKEVYLNYLKQYKDFCFARFLSVSNIKKTQFQKDSTCYFSTQKGAYPVQLPRDSINLLKISTDTNVNCRSNFEGERFLMSEKAFESLKLGAWYINTNLKTVIAGVKHYIIPDFVADFDLEKFKSEIKPKIDLAFQDRRDVERTKRRLEQIGKKGINSLTFIGYKIGQGDIDVSNRIQTVSPDRYNLIIESINNAKFFFDNKPQYSKDTLDFSFKTIYSIIPENDNTAKHALILFKNLFEGDKINKMILFDYFQKLINIYWYRQKDKYLFVGTNNIYFVDKPYRDTAISKATIKYLIILKMIDNLYNLDNMESEKFKIEESPKTKEFFDEFNFSSSKRAMFYLGKLIRRVAEAQTKQEHSHKPILNRISFSGMKLNDIKILNLEVLEKMKQYNKKYKTFNFGQQDLAKFEYYFCKAENNWELSDMESVFYLFAGYGMYWDVIEPKEKEALKDVEITSEADFETTENNNTNQ